MAGTTSPSCTSGSPAKDDGQEHVSVELALPDGTGTETCNAGSPDSIWDNPRLEPIALKLGEIVSCCWVQILGLAVWPAISSVIPVAFPFGNPFAKFGDNGIMVNWAYYFVYNPLGWGGIFLKIVVWNTHIWKVPLKQWRSLAAALIPTVFATCFFMVGYAIFKNPVPLGTLSFGVPAFGIQFLSIYFLLIPRQQRRLGAGAWTALLDHVQILRVFLAFVAFVAALCCYSAAVALQSYLLSQHGGNTLEYYAIAAGTMAGLTAVRQMFIAIPTRWFIHNHEGIAILWHYCFREQYSCYVAFAFPAKSPDWGIGCAVLISKFVGLLVPWLWMKKMNATSNEVDTAKLRKLASETASILIESYCPLHFLAIFVNNYFGPNRPHIYGFASMTDEQAAFGCWFILANSVVGFLCMWAARVIAAAKLNEATALKLFAFQVSLVTEWHVELGLLFASCATCCGACMIMMHDGMDLSLAFEEWQGTPPF